MLTRQHSFLERRNVIIEAYVVFIGNCHQVLPTDTVLQIKCYIFLQKKLLHLFIILELLFKHKPTRKHIYSISIGLNSITH